MLKKIVLILLTLFCTSYAEEEVLSGGIFDLEDLCTVEKNVTICPNLISTLLVKGDYLYIVMKDETNKKNYLVKTIFIASRSSSIGKSLDYKSGAKQEKSNRKYK